MAAADHLGEQFITSTELQSATAGDFPQFKVGQLHRGQVHGGYFAYDWDRLHKDIDNEGFKTPLHVTRDPYEDDSPILRNGHHRAIAAMERGALFVPTSEEPHPGGREDRGYRDSMKAMQANKPHPWVSQERKARPPLESPNQLSFDG